MRIIDLPTGWTVLLDAVAWVVIHLTIAYVFIRLPLSAFPPSRWLFRPRRWEGEGQVYERLFRIRRWKARLPSGGTLFGGFSMTQVASRDRAYLERWAAETRRAELTHWTAFLAAGLFFLWNPPAVGWLMVGYAAAVNLPCILVQRYNRLRLARALGSAA